LPSCLILSFIINFNMNFLFSQKEQSEYDYITKTIGQKRFTIGFKDTYLVKASLLTSCDLKPYWAQRSQDEIHINTIANGIRQSNGLFHPIILANIHEKQEYSILDGQHRFEALRRLSDTQLESIIVQVDVITFHKDDTRWILQQYEYINTSKSFQREELVNEINVAEAVGNIINQLKLNRIRDVIIHNKQNSKVNIVEFKNELLKRSHRLIDPVNKILAYNNECCEKYEEKFKKIRIGKKVKQECIDKKFWLGINFPQWLDEVFV